MESHGGGPSTSGGPGPNTQSRCSRASARSKQTFSSRSSQRLQASAVKTVAMSIRCLPLLVLLVFLCPSQASAASLSLSLDDGLTWLPLTEPLTTTADTLPSRVHLRASSSASAPSLHLPRCAVSDALLVSVVREKRGGSVLGLRWGASKACGGGWLRKKAGIIVREELARRVVPDWVAYLKERGPDGTVDGGEGGSERRRSEKGFFARYGLYLMGFVAIALAQGIRKGMAELREEMEREEAENLKERKPTGQVRVVVPRRKQSAKRRRKAAAPGRGSSSRK